MADNINIKDSSNAVVLVATEDIGGVEVQRVKLMLGGHGQDGGDVEIIDIKDTLVYCRLAGACQGCANASQTLRMMVERTLKDMVDERIRVIEV